MNARDLIRILFEIEDQEMTVRELRRLLVENILDEEQDNELPLQKINIIANDFDYTEN